MSDLNIEKGDNPENQNLQISFLECVTSFEAECGAIAKEIEALSSNVGHILSEEGLVELDAPLDEAEGSRPFPPDKEQLPRNKTEVLNVGVYNEAEPTVDGLKNDLNVVFELLAKNSENGLKGLNVARVLKLLHLRH